MTTIRPPAFSGSFYPEDEQGLKNSVNKYLLDAKPSDPVKEIKAVISPHAGYAYSGPIAAYGYKIIQARGQKAKNIIIIGTSHRMMFQGVALSNFDLWQTPLGSIPSSTLYKELNDGSTFKLLNEAHAFEHSIEVQLPFLQTILCDFEITPLNTGRITSHKEIALALNNYIKEDTLLVVSSDFSHYLSYKEAKKCDEKTIKKILALESTINQEEACGAAGIMILIELAKLNHWKPKLLDYRTSGDTSGEKTKVVGYASIIFHK
ncbi:AmmeMemoRadiSam system protein B [Candidatus Dojkabacteria bacterium]|nr:AmmeMemoRadiSam system protein B [Candidatus Dojkabacteria bacterium]